MSRAAAAVAMRRLRRIRQDAAWQRDDLSRPLDETRSRPRKRRHFRGERSVISRRYFPPLQDPASRGILPFRFSAPALKLLPQRQHEHPSPLPEPHPLSRVHCPPTPRLHASWRPLPCTTSCIPSLPPGPSPEGVPGGPLTAPVSVGPLFPFNSSLPLQTSFSGVSRQPVRVLLLCRRLDEVGPSGQSFSSAGVSPAYELAFSVFLPTPLLLPVDEVFARTNLFPRNPPPKTYFM